MNYAEIAMANGIPADALVAGVTLTIWFGLFAYLVRLDRKVKDLNR